MAMTQSPTSSVSESPSSTKGRLTPSTLIRAMSISCEVPISFASMTLPSESETLMSLALSTTWLLVRIYPSALMMKPGTQALPHLLPLRPPAAEEPVEKFVHLGIAEGRGLLDLDHLPGRDVHDCRHFLFDQGRERFRSRSRDCTKRKRTEHEKSEE